MVCERQRVRGGEERRRGGEGGGEEGGGEGGRTYDYFKENTSSPLAKAQKLWSTTERCQVVDSFCAMREWCMILYLSSSSSSSSLPLPLPLLLLSFSLLFVLFILVLGMNLLDVSAIKEGTSPTLTAQSYMLNAWMARLAHDYDKYVLFLIKPLFVLHSSPSVSLYPLLSPLPLIRL